MLKTVKAFCRRPRQRPTERSLPGRGTKNRGDLWIKRASLGRGLKKCGLQIESAGYIALSDDLIPGPQEWGIFSACQPQVVLDRRSDVRSAMRCLKSVKAFSRRP